MTGTVFFPLPIIPSLARLVLTRLSWVFATGDSRDAEILGCRAEYSAVRVEQGKRGRCWSAVSRLLYILIASVARQVVRSGRSKDLEIIVLRHQLTVLHRQIDRPALNNDDRTLLGAIAAALPRPKRSGWLVTPDTLLRWHRRRIARHWTQTT